MAKNGNKNNAGLWVAFLRGVNVGGNGLISMAALKKSFEQAGFKDVVTYINSGNVIFKTAGTDARKLEVKIEKILTDKHRIKSKVVVRSFSEIQKLVKNLPKNWTDVKLWRYYVIFLRHTVDSKKVLDELSPKKEIEEVLYHPGTLLWSARIKDITRSGMHKLLSIPLYKEITIRNLNTLNKIHELMKNAL